MFRRQRRTGFPRKQREPGIWVRQLISFSNTNILNTTAPITLATPTDLPSVVGTDQRYTLHRLLIKLTQEFTIGPTPAGAVVGDAFLLSMGIWFGQATESLSPELGGSSVDDWLWLHNRLVGASVAGANTIFVFVAATGGELLRNMYNEDGLIDLRTKRKMDGDQAIRMSVKFNGTEVSGSGRNIVSAATWTGRVITSALYKRTLR